MTKYFDKLLVANRGEIARRVIRTAKRLGIHTIAVCSEVDVDTPFAKAADEKHVIGAAPPAESYLRSDRILEVAKKTGAQAIHPGYGFLAENPSFARAVIGAGIAFVGPAPETMELVGSKLSARKLAETAGVPLIPGSGALATLDEARAAAEEIGYPVLLKAAAGGGGIGMSVVKSEKKLERAFEDAKKKGEMFFDDDTVYLERLVAAPAHVEVQIIGDHTGRVVALGERDCTVQRRHQKVLEETPSPRIDDETRARMLSAAVRLGEKASYVNAGTVEMIYAGEGTDAGSFYFLEVNARLQVEHPVTEMVLGLDLVELQLAVAAKEALPADLGRAAPRGHAFEARICAEDPDKRFFPSPGLVTRAVFPEGEGIRVDAGIESGTEVTPSYDSLLAKIIVHGDTREAAIARLVQAIEETKIEGIKSNVSVFLKIADNEVFRAGTHSTDFLKAQLGLKS